jgi:hypothetical protein
MTGNATAEDFIFDQMVPDKRVSHRRSLTWPSTDFSPIVALVLNPFASNRLAPRFYSTLPTRIWRTDPWRIILSGNLVFWRLT